MTIILFGANNPSGAAFLNACSISLPEIWGRRPPVNSNARYTYCDLTKPPLPNTRSISGVLVSFAPIWLLAPYITQRHESQSESLQNLKGIIACSSSSFITKRFAFNDDDKELAAKLLQAHEMLRDICGKLNIPLQILAPTLVYGKVNGYTDKNISKISQILHMLPFVILPKTTGLRQPIHASQLAAIAFLQVQKILSGDWPDDEPEVLALGGDSIITYENMISRIKFALEQSDAPVNCQVIIIPDKLFFFLATPLLLLNPKLFEAIMRIKSNLSGFMKVHEILRIPPVDFPLLPLSSQRKKTSTYQ
ncbi:MAG: hypothetical protein ACK6AD_05310 [Cyanobacteriota bacterium]|jgi:hypothetical protein